MDKRYEFGDRVKVNHDAPVSVAGRFGVVMRGTEQGAWLLFFDQSEAYVGTDHLRAATDAEWWGFLNWRSA